MFSVTMFWVLLPDMWQVFRFPGRRSTSIVLFEQIRPTAKCWADLQLSCGWVEGIRRRRKEPSGPPLRWTPWTHTTQGITLIFCGTQKIPSALRHATLGVSERSVETIEAVLCVIYQPLCESERRNGTSDPSQPILANQNALWWCLCFGV